MKSFLFFLTAACSGFLVADASRGLAAEASPEGLLVVVMDPLAAPLSCPCVEGYAQRKYECLGEYLQTHLDRPVDVVFAEALSVALKKHPGRKPAVIIGKDSVVRADAKKAGLRAKHLACLTGKDGATTQTGLIVVAAEDPATEVADLKDYRIFFGTADCSEKYDAAVELLRAAKVPLPEKRETTQACSEGACQVLDLRGSERAAAVISSYAKPLLEGCGTIKKGELKVIGETEPVPFIGAFVTEAVPDDVQDQIRESLLQAGTDAELCEALETLLGFIPAPQDSSAAAKKKKPALDRDSAAGWTGWRGPHRDGRCAWLPERLPTRPKVVWSQPLARPGLGGIAATKDYVILGDRDLEDMGDVFRCYDATTGIPLWTLAYPAIGKLDYGNMPRATPLIHGERVYLLGAFGDLHCVRMATGEVVWMRNLVLDFGVQTKLIWGMCASPLIADGKLIVNPGASHASLVALNPDNGDVIWESPGDRHAYASYICGKFGGVQQIIGYDRKTVGGWDLQTGERLWTLTPEYEGDFNVPTPVAVGDRLLLTTENNGTRLYAFSAGGQIVPRPIAVNEDLAPDMSTPVVVGNRLYCVWEGLYCLDLDDSLRIRWTAADDAMGIYGAAIASERQILVFGDGGNLLLGRLNGDRAPELSRLKVLEEAAAEQYSHPAIVGQRLYLRGEHAILCIDLNATE